MIGTEDARVLEETEKIEHMFSDDTIRCFQNFSNFMKSNPDISERYEAFLKNNP
jgi:Mn-dependent DtxR family transcriptional regulator